MSDTPSNDSAQDLIAELKGIIASLRMEAIRGACAISEVEGLRFNLNRVETNRDVYVDLVHKLYTELTEARRELDLMKTAGIIEVAVRNPSVSEYINHWEERALKAEAQLADIKNLKSTTQ